MKLPSTFSALIATSALSLLTAQPSAHAAVLKSGVMFNSGGGPIVICFASNLGTKPVTVVGVRGFRQDGVAVDVLATGPTQCLFAPVLQPGTSCEFETVAALVRMEVEIKGSAKSVRARCTLYSDGVPRDSAELR